MPGDYDELCPGSLQWVDEEAMQDSIDGAWTAICSTCGAELELGYGGRLPTHNVIEPGE